MMVKYKYWIMSVSGSLLMASSVFFICSSCDGPVEARISTGLQAAEWVSSRVIEYKKGTVTDIMIATDIGIAADWLREHVDENMPGDIRKAVIIIDENPDAVIWLTEKIRDSPNMSPGVALLYVIDAARWIEKEMGKDLF